MISKLVRSSIQYRWLVLLATLVLAVFGWFAFMQLPIDAVPDVTNVQVQVNTSVEALSPEEIERTVTVPVEIALNGVSGRNPSALDHAIWNFTSDSNVRR